MYRDAYQRYGQERNPLDVGGVRADASTSLRVVATSSSASSRTRAPRQCELCDALPKETARSLQVAPCGERLALAFLLVRGTRTLASSSSSDPL